MAPNWASTTFTTLPEKLVFGIHFREQAPTDFSQGCKWPTRSFGHMTIPTCVNYSEKSYASLGLDPKTSTVADYLDTDDRVSFRDTPAKASATMTLSASTRLWVKQRLGDMSS
jgi:hypothetical protein